MQITFDTEIMLYLETLVQATKLEYSGFGFVNKTKDGLFVYEFVLLNHGSEGFTEIPSKKIMELMDREDAKNMRLWAHRHPVDNWSGRDEMTIRTNPLGAPPKMMGWSASVVRTPHRGWLGRVDNYTTGKMFEAEVTPQFHEKAKEELRAVTPKKEPERTYEDWLDLYGYTKIQVEQGLGLTPEEFVEECENAERFYEENDLWEDDDEDEFEEEEEEEEWIM